MIENKDEILALWVKIGKPVVHIGDGENCFDLELLISHNDMLQRHVDAVNQWFVEHNK